MLANLKNDSQIISTGGFGSDVADLTNAEKYDEIENIGNKINQLNKELKNLNK